MPSEPFADNRIRAIDQITEVAWVERRGTIRNDGGDAVYSTATGNGRIGKFYPRGCRGFINVVQVYCRDNAAAGGTITVYLSPYVGAGYLYTANVVVAPAAAAAFRNATFNVMWEYDSLFIFMVCSVAGVQVAHDVNYPHDWHESADAGATWGTQGRRMWCRVILRGRTISDLPVSGTINNIQIPNASSDTIDIDKVLPLNTETVIYDIEGMGYIDLICMYVAAVANSHLTDLILYADGVECFNWSYNLMNVWGMDPYTQPLSLPIFLADGACTMMITKKFEFRRQLRISGLNTVAGVTVTVRAHPNLLR